MSLQYKFSNTKTDNNNNKIYPYLYFLSHSRRCYKHIVACRNTHTTAICARSFTQFTHASCFRTHVPVQLHSHPMHHTVEKKRKTIIFKFSIIILILILTSPLNQCFPLDIFTTSSMNKLACYVRLMSCCDTFVLEYKL